MARYAPAAMDTPKRPVFFALATCWIVASVIVTLSLTSSPRQLRAQDPTIETFNLVNAVRAEVGLAPYRLNPELTAAAEAHSAWGVSVGYFSHEGANGSRPIDRAVAAGYGEYGAIRISENIYWGTLATPQSAVTWWRNSPLHYAGMTSTRYVDIGVGVVYGESGGYFTLLFGAKTGSAPPVSDNPSDDDPVGSEPPQDDSVGEELPDVPAIVVSGPGPDGSIVHRVEEGQAIWTIAAAYRIPAIEILGLNGLNDSSIIFPGQEILIQAAPTPTPTLPPTATPLPATTTPWPTWTPPAVADADARPEAPDRSDPSESVIGVVQTTMRPAMGARSLLVLRALLVGTLVGGLLVGAVGLLLVGRSRSA